MATAATKRPIDPTVQLMLSGGRVKASYREALFDAANRAGMSVNEFVLTAAAEKLKASGRRFSGIFHAGDTAKHTRGSIE